MSIILLPILTTVSTWFICLVVKNPSFFLYTKDIPNERSLHITPTPKTGGIAIVVVIMLSTLLFSFVHEINAEIIFVMLGVIILSIISYLDDKFDVPQICRFMVHIFVAIILLQSGLVVFEYNYSILNWLETSIVQFVILFILILWAINLYNFMDGIDGLAAGMSIIGFGCYSVLGALSGNLDYSILSAVIAASSLGFLFHNFSPAKLFMGDVGSTSLGYLMAAFSIWGVSIDVFPWWIPFLVFSPFIVDSSVTLVRRLVNGEVIWKAHKSHYYQLLVASGWSHAKTSVFEYFLMITVALSAIAIVWFNDNIFIFSLLSFWAIVYVCLIWVIGKLK